MDGVNEKLSRAWSLDPNNHMCFLFNIIHLVQQFKWDLVYTDADPFIKYTNPPWLDIVNINEENSLQGFYLSYMSKIAAAKLWDKPEA